MGQIPLIIEPDRDDPDCAEILVDGTIAGRPFRFMLDTGAAKTQVVADEIIAALSSHAEHRSSGVFAASANPVVTVSDLVIGPLTAATLEVARVEPTQPGACSLLGMDVLSRRCCHFRFDSGVLDLERSPAELAGLDVEIGDHGHVYVDVGWPGVTARACWDTGAGITIVDQAFLLAHPGLFAEAGTSAGTDGTGVQVQTQTFLMTGARIGGAVFAPHKVACVDLSQANSTLARPMDLILGYPTLRQADWLFDFPAERWALTRRPGPQ
jgi:gag-polyprotein putative aspartyl protease